MKILSIGLDPALADPHSVAFLRQKKYFSEETAHVVLLLSGSPKDITDGSIRVIQPGASNKFFALCKALFICLKLSKKNNYDIVLAQDVLTTGLVGYIVARLRHIRLITQLHGDYLDNPRWTHEEFQNRILNILGKWILKRSDGIRCVSKRIQDFIISRYNIPREKTVSIPIGTDLSTFTPDRTKLSSNKIILFVGRLIPEKSPLLFLSVVIELMKKYPTLEAALAGDGTLRSCMEEESRKAGVAEKIHFLGSLKASELVTWYQKSWCLLHTAAWEGWGMPMIESLGSGCPVVTTDSGCANEAVIDGRNGFVVPVDDREALKKSTEKIIADESLRHTFSEAGIEDAKKWSFDSLKQKLISFYKNYAK